MNLQASSNRILLHYLLYFLLMLLVPLGVLTVIYVRVAQIVTVNTYNQNLAAMQTSAQTIASNLDDMANLTYNIAQNSQMNRFFRLESVEADGSVISQVYQTQRDLRSFTIANNMISGIQLYAANGGLVVDSQTSAVALDRYYGNVFGIEGCGEEEWRDAILPGLYQAELFAARPIVYGSASKRRITYAQSVPIFSPGYTSGNIFIYMDEEDMLRLFQSIPYRQGGFLLVLDSAGQAVIRDNPHQLPLEELNLDLSGGYEIQPLGGTDMLLISLADSRYGWQYIAAIPQSQVLGPTSEIRMFLAVMTLIALLLGLALAFLYAYKTSRPVVSVYRQLVGSGSISPHDLGGEIAELVKRNSDLKRRIDQQLPTQKMSFIHSLLTGGFRSEEDLRNHFEKLGLSLDAQQYAVLVVVLTDLDPNLSLRETGLYKELVRELLSGLSGSIGDCDMDFERIAVLVGISEAEGEEQRDRLSADASRIANRAMEHLGISLAFAGGTVDRLVDIPVAFSRVQAALYLGNPGAGGTVQWCSGADGEEAYYPVNLESRLIMGIQEGKVSAVFDVLDTLERHNGTALSQNHSHTGYQLIQLLYATLLRVATELPANNDRFLQQCSAVALELSRRRQAPRELFGRIRECMAAAAALNMDADLSGAALRARILEYVNEHYCDPQISLASVAAMFHITEVYLSRIFKGITGENFSRHVEKLRMEQANLLMKQGTHRIRDISGMVGYNSPQVFRRAYKRYFGISPSAYLSE